MIGYKTIATRTFIYDQPDGRSKRGVAAWT